MTDDDIRIEESTHRWMSTRTAGAVRITSSDATLRFATGTLIVR
jgi:hypothetical protein